VTELMGGMHRMVNLAIVMDVSGHGVLGQVSLVEPVELEQEELEQEQMEQASMEAEVEKVETEELKALIMVKKDNKAEA
jgi:hypothetical protein